jgi:hypothetical protein
VRINFSAVFSLEIMTVQLLLAFLIGYNIDDYYYQIEDFMVE